MTCGLAGASLEKVGTHLDCGTACRMNDFRIPQFAGLKCYGQFDPPVEPGSAGREQIHTGLLIAAEQRPKGIDDIDLIGTRKHGRTRLGSRSLEIRSSVGKVDHGHNSDLVRPKSIQRRTRQTDKTRRNADCGYRPQRRQCPLTDSDDALFGVVMIEGEEFHQGYGLACQLLIIGSVRCHG